MENGSGEEFDPESAEAMIRQAMAPGGLVLGFYLIGEVVGADGSHILRRMCNKGIKSWQAYGYIEAARNWLLSEDVAYLVREE